MRVLHVGAACGFGGVETVLSALVAEQLREGMRPDLFFYRDCGGARLYDGLCNVFFAHQQSLTEVLLNERYDVVHLITAIAEDAARSLRRARYSGAVVATCHGAFGGTANCHIITAVSRHTALKIQHECNSEVRVVYNGINLDRFRPGHDTVTSTNKPILAWVGRSSDPDKGYDGLVAIANSGIAQKFRIIVVDGSSESGVSETWLPDEADVIRQKPWEEMADFYRTVRASRGFLLSTSASEACPLNILEAQACGCPVIAPSIGGIPEIVVQHKTGYLYNRGDGTHSVKMALDWLYDDGRYEKVSNAAATYVMQTYPICHTAAGYAGIYEEALSVSSTHCADDVLRSLLSLGLRTRGIIQRLRARGGPSRYGNR